MATAIPDTITPTLAKWRELSNAIATAATSGGYETGTLGELTVIGSGLSLSDFTNDAEDRIREADHVFYCLYDTMARIWIKSVRPDALDLHVLYDAKTLRYYTYVRMAEAMLHYVRQGKRVVAVYYGHPGVFATPTHRAIAIARREGHKTLMRPAVSALDYLVADLGFDPALPGLLTYEATDMMLRSRMVDPSLHVVLWQVGLVGDLGYNRTGFQNAGFVQFVDYILQHYGEDWTTFHYIAPKFRGLKPLIRPIKLRDLKKPEVIESITAISTFYLPPKEYRDTSVDTARKMGIPDGTYEMRFRNLQYDSYTAGDNEMIGKLADFEFNREHPELPAGPVYRLLKAMSDSAELTRQYLADPRAFASGEKWGLDARQIELMSIPHSQAFDAALYEQH